MEEISGGVISEEELFQITFCADLEVILKNYSKMYVKKNL